MRQTPKVPLLALLLIPLLSGLDDPTKDDIKVVSAPDARKHVGKECTVELTVKASKTSVHQKCYFLDSEEDYHSDDCFTVVIPLADAPNFARAGIEDPATHFRGKTIRVLGRVIEESDQIRIKVTDPKQIKVVDKKA